MGNLMLPWIGLLRIKIETIWRQIWSFPTSIVPRIELLDALTVMKISHSDVTTEAISPPALYVPDENWIVAGVSHTEMSWSSAVFRHSFRVAVTADEVGVRKHELFSGVWGKVTSANIAFTFF